MRFTRNDVEVLRRTVYELEMGESNQVKFYNRPYDSVLLASLVDRIAEEVDEDPQNSSS